VIGKSKTALPRIDADERGLERIGTSGNRDIAGIGKAKNQSSLCPFAYFAVKGFAFQFSLFGNPGHPVSPVLAFWGGRFLVFAFPIPAMTRDVGDHGDLPAIFPFEVLPCED
jgi:hypothetical protein